MCEPPVQRATAAGVLAPAPGALRDALGCFATGITVVTALDPGGRPVGVTVNSFSSVSLQPPLVLYCLGRDALAGPALLAAPSFAVNVLAVGQRALSDRFAAVADDFDGVAYDGWETGAPILAGCVASFECARRGGHDGGDHVIVIGEVLRLRRDPLVAPLLYCRGRYAGLDWED